MSTPNDYNPLSVEGKPHWFVSYFLPVLTLILGLLFTFLTLGSKSGACSGISGLLALIGLLWTSSSVLKNRNAYFKITNTAILAKHKGKDITIPFEKVEKVKVVTNPLVSSLGYCSIQVISEGQKLTFQGIDHENEIINAIKNVFPDKHEIGAVIKD